MEKNKENVSKKFIYVTIALCAILLIIFIIGSLVFSNREDEVIEKKVKGGNITLNYTNDITGLKLSGISPVTDSVGMKNEKEEECFDFSVDIDINNAKYVKYEIAVVKDKDYSNISDDDIKIYLEKENSGSYVKVFGPESYKAIEKDSKLGSPEDSMILIKSKKTKDIKENYRLRMWLSDKSVTKKGNYSVEVIVNGKAF